MRCLNKIKLGFEKKKKNFYHLASAIQYLHSKQILSPKTLKGCDMFGGPKPYSL